VEEVVMGLWGRGEGKEGWRESLVEERTRGWIERARRYEQ